MSVINSELRSNPPAAADKKRGVVRSTRNVGEALTGRLGTFLSALVLGYGMEQEQVALMVPAGLVMVGVGMDMVVARVIKRMGE